MKTPTCVALLCAAVLACAGPTRSESESDVRKRIDLLIDASNRRDLEAAVGSYCPDAVMHPPTGNEVRGRDAIRARYTTLYDNWLPTLTVEHSATSVDGDLATDRGATHGRLSPLTPGQDLVVEDVYEARLRRDNGVWRVLELTWRPKAAEH